MCAATPRTSLFSFKMKTLMTMLMLLSDTNNSIHLSDIS